MIGPEQDQVRAIVADLGLQLDYELVTGDLAGRPEKQQFIEEVLLPAGFGFSGHGHEHTSHDLMGGEWSYEAAVSTAKTLGELGIPAVAFAYPEGHGRTQDVQQAIADAGFLSARMFDGADVFIVPNDERTPTNWFMLPSLRMESLAFEGEDRLVNDTQELIPYLHENEQRGSWLDSHLPRNRPAEGLGLYELDEFRTDMEAIANSDAWAGSLNDTTLYIYEYETAELTIAAVESGLGCEQPGWAIALEDGRDDVRFSVPLSVIVQPGQVWTGRAGTWNCPGRQPILVSFTDQPAIVDVLPDGQPCTLTVDTEP